jgi:hypothetical protein
MIRTLLHLGQTPLKRRMVAAVLLVGTALGVTWLRAAGEQFWIELAINLLTACAAFGFLHYRWRAREQREMTPAKAKDIFS